MHIIPPSFQSSFSLRSSRLKSLAAVTSAEDGLAAAAADRVSLASSSSGDSASATLMSSHAMKMGLYSINLGTKFGQRMHAAHMLILPLIPVFILLAQNGTNYATFVLEAEEIQSVQNQVQSVLIIKHVLLLTTRRES